MVSKKIYCYCISHFYGGVEVRRQNMHEIVEVGVHVEIGNQCCGSKYIDILDPDPGFWPNLDPDPGSS